jgi:hypothetical protein
MNWQMIKNFSLLFFRKFALLHPDHRKRLVILSFLAASFSYFLINEDRQGNQYDGKCRDHLRSGKSISSRWKGEFSTLQELGCLEVSRCCANSDEDTKKNRKGVYGQTWVEKHSFIYERGFSIHARSVIDWNAPRAT